VASYRQVIGGVNTIFVVNAKTNLFHELHNAKFLYVTDAGTHELPWSHKKWVTWCCPQGSEVCDAKDDHDGTARFYLAQGSVACFQAQLYWQDDAPLLGIVELNMQNID
jgi:hypothetical protein